MRRRDAERCQNVHLLTFVVVKDAAAFRRECAPLRL